MSFNLSMAIVPSDIVSNQKKLSIPIYQRLFVWGNEQIDKLLDDLWDARNGGDHYYLGVITVHENEDHQWEIVDGQQRLTFLTLLGCVLARKNQHGNADWRGFSLANENEPRLFFHGRREDREDILKYVTGSDQDMFSNHSFARFSERFDCFSNGKSEDEIKQFSCFCFFHAAFLVNELPSAYRAEELNLYFEKMNSTGRQLSPIEVVKGKWFCSFADRWNECMNFDKRLPPNISAHEAAESMKDTNNWTLQDVITGRLTSQDAIGDESATTVKSRLIMRDDVLALHVLKMIDPSVIIDRSKIIESFKSASQKGLLDAEAFINQFEKYRRWIDDCIIYLKDDNGTYDYAFRQEDNCPKSDNEEGADCSFDDKQMKQFQSMLYMSSGDAQEWVLKAYQTHQKSITLDLLKQQLVEQLWNDCETDCQTILNSTEWPERLLMYGTDNRRWLALLDYLLWEEFALNGCSRDHFDLTEGEKVAIEKFIFHRNNRSVEHLHPQTDVDSANQNEWAKELSGGGSVKHHFGNLALISPGKNSEYRNAPVDEKAAKVARLIDVKSIESIKLLLMLKKCEMKDTKWTPEKARSHANDMLMVLKPFLQQSHRSPSTPTTPSV